MTTIAHLSRQECSRCNPLACLCKCHDPDAGHDELCEWDEVMARMWCSRAHTARIIVRNRRSRARIWARIRHSFRLRVGGVSEESPA